MSVRDALRDVLAGKPLGGERMAEAMHEILQGETPPALLAGFAVALRMRGETTTELAAAARVLREQGASVDFDHAPLLDTCGTGGDGLSTFNISTVSAIVVAAAGVKVAKHGNRAVSSRAGSADVLEALGVRLDLDHSAHHRCLDELGITFLFAPAHHKALRHAAGVRRELGLRTFFNLLGPLANPAAATHQLVGVFDPNRVTQLAEVLGALGTQAAWVVHGEGGLDEIAPSGVTQVAVLNEGRVEAIEVTPEDFGVEPVPLSALAGGDANDNAAIARQILSGEKFAPRHAVLLNAGAALCVAGAATTPREGAELAASVLDDGRAKSLLERWAARTQELA